MCSPIASRSLWWAEIPRVYVSAHLHCNVERSSSNSELYKPIMPPTLTDLPSEVILEQLLPLLPLKDVLRLSQVNHQLHTLTVRLLPSHGFSVRTLTPDSSTPPIGVTRQLLIFLFLLLLIHLFLRRIGGGGYILASCSHARLYGAQAITLAWAVPRITKEQESLEALLTVLQKYGSMKENLEGKHGLKV